MIEGKEKPPRAAARWPMNSITIENFRCFAKPGQVPIRPLTLLVGENSSGKTSFLSAIRLAWDIAFGHREIDFNEEPFLLGAFDQIAHVPDGERGQAESFRIESENPAPFRAAPLREGDGVVVHGAAFHRNGAHPAFRRATLRYGRAALIAEFRDDGELEQAAVEIGRRDRRLDVSRQPFLPRADSPVDWGFLKGLLLSPPHPGSTESTKDLVRSDSAERTMEDLDRIVRYCRSGRPPRPVATAPVRTRPQRTYDPITESHAPEGHHVPMMLARIYRGDKKRWRTLKCALDSFGEASGLFSSLAIKLLGDHDSDPFRIMVEVNGSATNLVDVGYGVSQVLPILVDALTGQGPHTHLLQQPEVHLHPRGQAELGSFFAERVGSQDQRFVVETHSDYLLNRIRMCVRDGTAIRPEDVALLFFERQGADTQIHHIEIDEMGNLTNAPTSYAKFFLAEQRRFLSG